MNLLIQKYCDTKNQSKKACHSILLPSFLSSGCVLRNVVESIILRCDIERVDTMFLPVHMADECHWVLAIFSVKEQTIRFDDGYHCPIPENLRRNAIEIISIMYRLQEMRDFNPQNGINSKDLRLPCLINHTVMPVEQLVMEVAASQ